MKIVLKLLKNYNPLEAVSGSRAVSSFSVRASGNMSLSYGQTSRALENRKSFLSSLNIDYQDLICAKQVHGSKVKYVNEADQGSGAFAYDTAIPDTDGFITDIRNLPLGILTADCLSIFLYDSQRPAVGLIHAGWRSSKENIVSRAIELMHNKFETNPAELFAGFGPTIKNCCYEVSGEFKHNFATGLTRRQGRVYLDLAAVNKKQLNGLGVKEKNIFDSEFCTHCEAQDFFSFRREGKISGRVLSVIMLK